MTSFLLIICFLLLIILFISVFQLNQRIQKVKKTANEEMEDILVAFLEEMKLENEQLKASLQNERVEMNSELMHKTNYPKQSALEVRQERVPIDIHNEQSKKERKKRIPSEQAVLPIDQILQNQTEDIVEQSEEAKIISMYEQGVTIEEIAKKLKRGKTEIELIVKIGGKQER